MDWGMTTKGITRPAASDSASLAEDGLGEKEVCFGVDADGVVVCGFDIEAEAILEEAELFETLGTFELARRQCGEAVERGLAIGV